MKRATLLTLALVTGAAAAKTPEPRRNTVSGPEFSRDAFVACLKTVDGGKPRGEAPKEPNDVDRCYDKAAVQPPQPLVGGGHTSEVISAIVQFHLPGIRACHERALGKHEKLGDIDATLVIIVNFVAGSVEEASVKVDKGKMPSEMRACIVEEVTTWMFPHRSLSERTTVKYPFKFRR